LLLDTPASKRSRMTAEDYVRAKRSVASKSTRASFTVPSSVVSGSTRLGGLYSRGVHQRKVLSANPELKFVDANISTICTVGNSGVAQVASLFGNTANQLILASGTSQSQRVGRKVTLKSVQIKGYYGPSVATPGDEYHIWIVLDTQYNGATTSISEIIDNTNLSIARPVIANGERFKVLKKIVLNSMSYPTYNGGGVSGVSGGAPLTFDYFKKLELDMEWNGTAGDQAEIRSNNILIVSGCIYGSNPATGKVVVARVRYTDC
jgi:hypothetical protein